MQALWHIDAGHGRPDECPGQNQALRDAESLDVIGILREFGTVLLHVTELARISMN